MKKQKSKFVYCPVLRQGLEYTEFISEAKRIASELEKVHKEGFLDGAQEEDKVKMASVLAMFKAAVEEVHIPMTQERAASKWDEMRKMLK